MHTVLREGTLDELAQMMGRIPEFQHATTAEQMADRIQGAQHLAQIAMQGGPPVGFKLGYALGTATFYSWLGGVVPEARGQGVATQLLRAQEQWAADQGFTQVRVSSRPRFPSMVRLLQREGYTLTHTERRPDPSETRLRFVKHLQG